MAINGVTSGATNKYEQVIQDVANGFKHDLLFLGYEIKEGNTDKALEMHGATYKSASEYMNQNGEYSDAEARSILSEAYNIATNSENGLAADLLEETHSSFFTGIFEGIPGIGLFADSKSREEAISEVQGSKAPFGERIKELAGSITSGTATGAAVGSIIPGVGTVLGAAAGGLTGFVQNVLKTVLGNK